MHRRIAALALPFVLAASLAACGDGPEESATPTTPAQQTATTAPPGATAAPTIDAPTVPDRNIDAISPPHGAKVPQAETQSPIRDDPRNGACVQVNFEGLPEQFQWVRMVFDEEEVTVSPDVLLLVAQNAQSETPSGGSLCYAPAAGFEVGVHTVTVAIQNPTNPNEPTRQLIQWQFEVIP